MVLWCLGEASPKHEPQISQHSTALAAEELASFFLFLPFHMTLTVLFPTRK